MDNFIIKQNNESSNFETDLSNSKNFALSASGMKVKILLIN